MQIVKNDSAQKIQRVGDNAEQSFVSCVSCLLCIACDDLPVLFKLRYPYVCMCFRPERRHIFCCAEEEDITVKQILFIQDHNVRIGSPPQRGEDLVDLDLQTVAQLPVNVIDTDLRYTPCSCDPKSQGGIQPHISKSDDMNFLQVLLIPHHPGIRRDMAFLICVSRIQFCEMMHDESPYEPFVFI